MRHRALAAAPLALLLSLALTACGLLPGQDTTTAPTAQRSSAPASAATTPDEPSEASSDTSSEPSSDEPPATGDRVTGEGYSYAVPDKWADATTEMKKEQPLVDTAVMSTEAVDSFRDNVNVVPATNSETSADDLERSLVNELSGSSDFEDVTAKDRVQIDGVEAAQVWSQIKNASFSTVQFVCYYEGRTYVITYSGHADHAEASQQALDFLDGWRWE